MAQHQKIFRMSTSRILHDVLDFLNPLIHYDWLDVFPRRERKLKKLLSSKSNAHLIRSTGKLAVRQICQKLSSPAHRHFQWWQSVVKTSAREKIQVNCVRRGHQKKYWIFQDIPRIVADFWHCDNFTPKRFCMKLRLIVRKFGQQLLKLFIFEFLTLLFLFPSRHLFCMLNFFGSLMFVK